MEVFDASVVYYGRLQLTLNAHEVFGALLEYSNAPEKM